MTDDEVGKLAAVNTTAELVVALESLAERPADFVVATSERVFVGGNAEAHVGGVTYQHTGDGTFTRHELNPVVEPEPVPVVAAPAIEPEVVAEPESPIEPPALVEPEPAVAAAPMAEPETPVDAAFTPAMEPPAMDVPVDPAPTMDLILAPPVAPVDEPSPSLSAMPVMPMSVPGSAVSEPPPVPDARTGPPQVPTAELPQVEAPPVDEAPVAPAVDSQADVPIDAADAADPGVVLVRGLLCQRGHLVHESARMCPLCGDNMQNRSLAMNADGTVGQLGPRPPLGVLIMADGKSHQLERTTIIGRAPEIHPDVVAGHADFIRVDDTELSRTHLRFLLEGWDVLVEDLGSTNGSRLGAGTETMTLQPEVAVRLVRGVEVHFGTTIMSYQPTSAAQP